MPQGTCVYVRPGRRQKMTPDLYLSAFKSRVLWLNTTTEQFARCKTLRLNRWFSAPCQVILPWQRWLQRYQLFIFFSIFSFLILTHERRHSQIFLSGSCSCDALVFWNMRHCWMCVLEVVSINVISLSYLVISLWHAVIMRYHLHRRHHLICRTCV